MRWEYNMLRNASDTAPKGVTKGDTGARGILCYVVSRVLTHPNAQVLLFRFRMSLEGNSSSWAISGIPCKSIPPSMMIINISGAVFVSVAGVPVAGVPAAGVPVAGVSGAEDDGGEIGSVCKKPSARGARAGSLQCCLSNATAMNSRRDRVVNSTWALDISRR